MTGSSKRRRDWRLRESGLFSEAKPNIVDPRAKTMTKHAFNDICVGSERTRCGIQAEKASEPRHWEGGVRIANHTNKSPLLNSMLRRLPQFVASASLRRSLATLTAGDLYV
jgi:hypothetical protein